jgi:zinc and cadmium transporter
MIESHMPQLPLLAAYGGLILLASLAGGWLTILVQPTHARLQLSTSFVAGLMLGVGLLHLLPHAWHQMRSLDQAVSWLMAGFLVVFFIQRFFHFHHHDVPEDPQPAAAPSPRGSSPDDGHAHLHAHDTCPHSLAEQSARRLSWSGASLGLLLHSILDGVAVAAAVQAEAHGKHGLLFGVGTFLVVLLHKPFDAMAVGTLMARGDYSRSFRHWINGILAMAVPAGMVLFHFGFSQSGNGSVFLGAALAFSAGTFLCIAASDLLPELQFHAHDRWKLSFSLLAGLALSVAIGGFEKSGHDRHEVPGAVENSHGAEPHADEPGPGGVLPGGR